MQWAGWAEPTHELQIPLQLPSLQALQHRSLLLVLLPLRAHRKPKDRRRLQLRHSAASPHQAPLLGQVKVSSRSNDHRKHHALFLQLCLQGRLLRPHQLLQDLRRLSLPREIRGGVWEHVHVVDVHPVLLPQPDLVTCGLVYDVGLKPHTI